jgi:hypothetical protein
MARQSVRCCSWYDWREVASTLGTWCSEEVLNAFPLYGRNMCGDDVMIVQHARRPMVQRFRKWSNGHPCWWSYRSAQHKKDGREGSIIGELILVKSTSYMGGHGIHNNMEVEVAVCEWLRMQEPDFYCDETLNSRQGRAYTSLCPRMVLKGNGTSEKLMNRNVQWLLI